MALKITMFSDFVCPFCYIGFEVIRKLKPEFHIDLEWRGYQIHPEWPPEGIPAEQVHAPSDMDARRAAWQRITAMAEAEGLEITAPTVFTSSRAALAACEFAREQGGADELEGRIYRAYFVEGANIGDANRVARLGAECGFDENQVAQAIRAPQYELRLKNNALVARQRSVSGVPTFFIGEYPLVGAQSSQVMRQILQRATERVIATA
jgi:predicted DsbA family dithiol-disulfide isomerase